MMAFQNKGKSYLQLHQGKGRNHPLVTHEIAIAHVIPISTSLSLFFTFKENITFIPEVLLVGGFNPFEKYQSNWIISPGKVENKKYLKPPNQTRFLSISSSGGSTLNVLKLPTAKTAPFELRSCDKRVVHLRRKRLRVESGCWHPWIHLLCPLEVRIHGW